MDNIIEIKDLCVSFDGVKVVRGVNLKVRKGEIHGILGESGSGKTVTSYAIGRLHDKADYQGDILFNKESILAMDEVKLSTIRGYDIAYVFQSPHESFNPNMRIGRQLREALSIHGLQPDHEKIRTILLAVGLKEPDLILRKYPDQLSGGECQRVMIGMSLLCDPQVLIADEPTSAIDASIKMQILHLLKDINEKFKTTIIIISHDMDLVKYVCDDMTVMYGGLVMEQGPTDKVLTSPLHPYTKALIDCTVSLNEDIMPLKTLDGLPLSPDLYQERCPFYERCSLKLEVCKDKMPLEVDYNKRRYRCHLEGIC